MTEITTIQLHLETKTELDALKLCPEESYENVIKRLLKRVPEGAKHERNRNL